MTPKRTLLLILAFIVLTVGSFIWFVATWNAEVEQPVSQIQIRDTGLRA